MFRLPGALLAAIAFFTRIPCRAGAEHLARSRAAAPACGPLVGWLVGALAAATFALAMLILPAPVSVAIAFLVPVLVTGALHEDGLADFADGFGAGWDREQVLAIMGDSRIGVYGVVALVALLLVEYVSLAAIAAHFAAAGYWPVLAAVGVTLVSAHAFSRYVCVSFMFTHTYARVRDPDNPSRASAMSVEMSAGAHAFALVTGFAPALVYWPLGLPACLFAAAPALVLRVWLGRLFTRRLGGYTGDCLGAAQALSRVVWTVSVCALIVASSPMP